MQTMVPLYGLSLDQLADQAAELNLLDDYRALELDESYDQGAIHGVLITLDSLPESMGGDPQRARHHFDRAVELSGGNSVGPYVSLAESVVVAEQDWREFRELLETALAIDPEEAPSLRLLNTIGQQPEDKVKSITGRQEILRKCETKVQALLEKETGKPLVKKLLFTQWLDR